MRLLLKAASYTVKGEYMKRFLTALLTVLASIMLIIAMLVVSIEMFALNSSFYKNEYKKLSTASSIGISEQDLERVTDVLISYTAGKAPTLDVQAQIAGEEQEVFGEREKAHMVDVQALYIGARNVRTICLIAAPIFILLAFFVSRAKALKIFCKSFLITSGVFLGITAALTVFAVVDFNSFWTSFHHVFFTNDLWLLDPNTDVLIMMVPEQFFFDLVTRIIIRFVSIFVIFNAAAFTGLKLYNRKAVKKVEQ